MLDNGHIGVCSTLGHIVSADQLNFNRPDLESTTFRIFYNAYLNAVLNYSVEPEEKLDIFQHIDFKRKKQIVMVGFFRPVVAKFKEMGIPLKIFDRIENDEILNPYADMKRALNEASSVILTSTSIFNGTFLDITEQTPQNSDIFLLGPSSILHPDMKKYRNVNKVYGALFNPYDENILDIIAQGHGTQTFLKFGQKVNI